MCASSLNSILAGDYEWLAVGFAVAVPMKAKFMMLWVEGNTMQLKCIPMQNTQLLIFFFLVTCRVVRAFVRLYLFLKFIVSNDIV